MNYITSLLVSVISESTQRRPQCSIQLEVASLSHSLTHRHSDEAPHLLAVRRHPETEAGAAAGRVLSSQAERAPRALIASSSAHVGLATTESQEGHIKMKKRVATNSTQIQHSSLLINDQFYIHD